MPKTLLKLSELVRSTNVGSLIITGADLIPRYITGTAGQILKVQPDGTLLFENEFSSISINTDVNNDLDNTNGLFLDVSQADVTDTNNLVTGSVGGTTEVTLQSLIDSLSNTGTGTTQTLSILGNDLTISGGNTIPLPTSNDTNTFSTLTGRTITFEDNNTIEVPDQNNISKVIEVTSNDLVTFIGTLEEQIAQYINTLNYNKLEEDSEIWINYTEIIG